MTNGECIYRKTVDYKSRMALEKDDFRRFLVICDFVIQEIGSRRVLHQGWKCPLRVVNAMINRHSEAI